MHNQSINTQIAKLTNRVAIHTIGGDDDLEAVTRTPCSTQRRIQILENCLGLLRIQRETIPACAEFRRAPQGALAMTADDDRNVRLLHGFRIHAAGFELKVLTVVADDRFCPQSSNEFEKLIAPRAPVLPTVTAGDDFFFAPADTDPEIDTTTGEPVERCEFLGGVDGVALGQQADPGAEAQISCGAGQKTEGGDSVE